MGNGSYSSLFPSVLNVKIVRYNLVTISAGKVAYGFAWAGTAVTVPLEVRDVIYKARHIHLYNKKKKEQGKKEMDSEKKKEQGKKEEDKTISCDSRTDSDDDIDDDYKSTGNVGDQLIGYLTDTIRDMTISERAKQLRKNVKILKKETARIEKDETIQKLIDE